ncbi:hypothetical protein SBDP1_1170034 [Syntrophobacter sp. SbD1]|nr:hypothetical protein SBDP1_1170034 [Syntrophobacter sp. SbD1]
MLLNVLRTCGLRVRTQKDRLNRDGSEFHNYHLVIAARTTVINEAYRQRTGQFPPLALFIFPP